MVLFALKRSEEVYFVGYWSPAWR